MTEVTAPHLRVVRGDPTPDELAVLAAVVAASAGGRAAPVERVRRGGWSDPAYQLRRPLHPGSNAWRASSR